MTSRHKLISIFTLVALSAALVLAGSFQIEGVSAEGGFQQDDPPFHLNSKTWRDKQAFIDSGARCSTRAVNDREARTVQDEVDRFNAARGFVSSPSTISIPVYFHIINNGPGIDNGDVTNRMITDQIRVLNRSYGGQTGGAETGFQFFLAGVTHTTNSDWYNMTPGSQEEVEAKTALRQGGVNALNFYTANLGGGCLASLLSRGKSIMVQGIFLSTAWFVFTHRCPAGVLSHTTKETPARTR